MRKKSESPIFCHSGESRNPVFLNQLRKAWTPEPAPDLDPGFTGVTTSYETVNIHSQANKRRLTWV